MKTTRARGLAALALAGVLAAFGCEGDGDNPYAAKMAGKPSAGKSSGNTASSASQDASTTNAAQDASATKPAKAGIVGTWALTGGGTTWYAHFRDDGSWGISDDAAGAKPRVHGTYTAADGAFSGPMVNPGTGEGDIKGTYSGTSKL